MRQRSNWIKLSARYTVIPPVSRMSSGTPAPKTFGSWKLKLSKGSGGSLSSGCRCCSQRHCVPPRTRPSLCDRQRSEEHTSELQSRQYLVCRLLLEKKKKKTPALFDLDNHH